MFSQLEHVPPILRAARHHIWVNLPVVVLCSISLLSPLRAEESSPLSKHSPVTAAFILKVLHLTSWNHSFQEPKFCVYLKRSRIKPFTDLSGEVLSSVTKKQKLNVLPVDNLSAFDFTQCSFSYLETTRVSPPKGKGLWFINSALNCNSDVDVGLYLSGGRFVFDLNPVSAKEKGYKFSLGLLKRAKNVCR